MRIRLLLVVLCAFGAIHCQYQSALDEKPVVQSTGASSPVSHEEARQNPCYLDATCQHSMPIPDKLLRSAVTITMDQATEAGYSGVLLNNTRGDRAPYVLTARHTRSGRLDDLNESLSWLEFHTGYRNDRCGVQRQMLPCNQDPCCIQGGIVVATGASRDGWDGRGPSDFRLVRLSRSIPASCNVAYAGWSIDTTQINQALTIGYPRGRPLAAAFADAPLRGITDGASTGMLHAPITEGQLVLGQSGSPLATHDGNVLGVVRTGTLCPPREGAGTYVATLVHNWYKGPEGNRLVDLLAEGNTQVRSLSSLD